MIKVSKDVPKFIIEMLSAVDYSKITDAHYDDWIKIIKANIGKHLKMKTKPKVLLTLNYPIRQDLCDLINRYDFSGLTLMKQTTIIPIAKKWANENLPLLKKFKENN